MTAGEQRKQGAARRMSMVLWDMFTGSAPIGTSSSEVSILAFWRRSHGPLCLGIQERRRRRPRGSHRRRRMNLGVLGRDYSDQEVICRQANAATGCT
jgi:hypothetical protein